jgi:DUF971 family protein
MLRTSAPTSHLEWGMSQNPADTPVNIRAQREAGLVTIDWADGHVSEFGAEMLRLMCPCAFCQGEAGRPGWLDTNPTLTPVQAQLVDMRLVGSYAIAPTWGDGHDTGYYEFESLRASCPCPICTAARSSSSWIETSRPSEGAGSRPDDGPAPDREG